MDLLGSYAQQQDELTQHCRSVRKRSASISSGRRAARGGTVRSAADGAPNGYGVFEYDGTSLTNMIYKPTRYDETFQIRLYKRRRRLYGRYGQVVEVRSATAEEPADGHVWNADDTWTIEVYENGVKTGDMAKKSMIDPWSSAYFCGFCGLKESYASKNDHIFYYTVKSPGAALRVVARDGYGNVFEQTEIHDAARSGLSRRLLTARYGR